MLSFYPCTLITLTPFSLFLQRWVPSIADFQSSASPPRARRTSPSGSWTNNDGPPPEGLPNPWRWMWGRPPHRGLFPCFQFLHWIFKEMFIPIQTANWALNAKLSTVFCSGWYFRSVSWVEENGVICVHHKLTIEFDILIIEQRMKQSSILSSMVNTYGFDTT